MSAIDCVIVAFRDRERERACRGRFPDAWCRICQSNKKDHNFLGTLNFYYYFYYLIAHSNLSISVPNIICDNGEERFHILLPLAALHSSMKLKKTSRFEDGSSSIGAANYSDLPKLLHPTTAICPFCNITAAIFRKKSVQYSKEAPPTLLAFFSEMPTTIIQHTLEPTEDGLRAYALLLYCNSLLRGWSDS